MNLTLDWHEDTKVGTRRRVVTSPWLWLVGFALLILANRITGLGTEIVNWDEDTFMLMAEDVLRGHLPYVAMFDNKPPGIFLWSAGVLGLFGPSVAAVRLAGAVWVFAAAVAVFQIARRFAPVPHAGIAVLLMLTAASDPIAGGFNSTEWPCVALLLAALWLQMVRGERLWAAFLAGLFAALAVLFRSNAAVVAGVFGLIYGAGFRFKGLGLHRAAVIPFAAGLILPPALLAAVYATQGQFHALWLANVTVPYSYARGQNGLLISVRDAVAVSSAMAMRWPFTLGPVLALAGFGAWKGFARLTWRHRDILKLTAASAAALFSILVCGTYFPHYLVQALPFAAPWAAIGLTAERRGWAAMTAAAAATALLLWQVWTGATVLANLRTITANYDVRRAADALRPVLKPRDAIWAVKDHLILVYLGRPPISPAAMHPSNIMRPSIIRPLTEAGYVPPDAFGHAVASLPAYIVTDANRPVPEYLHGETGKCLAHLLRTRYAAWHRFGGVGIYRRNAAATPLHCQTAAGSEPADF